MAWNRPNSGEANFSRQKKRPALLKGAIAGLIVVAVLGIAAAFLFRPEPQEAQDSERPSSGRIKEVTPAPAPKPAPKPPDPRDDPKFDGLDKSRIRKAANGSYVYLPRRGEKERWPGERAQALAMIGGTNGVMLDRRVVEDPEHPFMFHNAMQSDLVQFARPGEFAVPIDPNIKDEVAWEAIKSPIVDHKNDSDRQLEEKQFVRDLLAQLKEHMEKGGHARDFIKEYQARQDLECEAMQTTRANVQEMINAGDLEGARALRDSYNKYLAEKGLPALNFRKLRKLDEADAARQAEQQEQEPLE